MIDFENPLELLRAEDPILVGVELRSLNREPTLDPEIIELVEGLMLDTRFSVVALPPLWAPIRLCAGYALASIRQLQGDFEPVIVKGTTEIIHGKRNDVWDVVLPIKKHHTDPFNDGSDILLALQEAFEKGLLPTIDFEIKVGAKIVDYTAIWGWTRS